jgi:REP-associated tyrosine transposase
MCTFERRRYFEDASLVALVRRHLLHALEKRYGEITAYCFMPDHLHALTIGVSDDFNARHCADIFRRQSAYHFRQTRHGRLRQEGYYDRVLRKEEATPTVVRYIIENPVRAGLCLEADAYPFSGSSKYSLEELVAL